MRRYTVVFLDQGIETDETATFDAGDQAAALDHMHRHFLPQFRRYQRAEVSSMSLRPDPSTGSLRAVSDSLENPYEQDFEATYDARTERLEVDFESTATAVLADLAVLRTPLPGRR